MTATPQRARLGVSLMFFTNGALFSALLPRLPELKSSLALSDLAFGFVVVAFPLGSICAAVIAAPLVRRFGARWVVAVGSVLLAAAIAMAGASTVVALLAAALLLAGALDAVVDAAQNIQAVVVEQWRQRSTINSLHAVWSLGAVTGGAIGTWAAAHSIDLFAQLCVTGAAWSVVAVVACGLAATPAPDVTTSDDAPGLGALLGGGTGSRRPLWLLAPLVVLAMCGTLVEDVANNWAVLFLGRETSTPVQLAGLGYTVVLVSQFIGRLVGDPLTDRWGRAKIARAGGVLIAVGFSLVVIGGTFAAFAGFALAGLGCATLVPAAFAAAGRIPGLAHGTGIALLGWLMRLGFLVTSPLIGAISQVSNLRLALVVPVVAGVVVTIIAHQITRQRTTDDLPSEIS